MEKSQHYQAGMQQYDNRIREEQINSRMIPGINSTTGIPPKYYSEDYKIVRGQN